MSGFARCPECAVASENDLFDYRDAPHGLVMCCPQCSQWCSQEDQLDVGDGDVTIDGDRASAMATLIDALRERMSDGARAELDKADSLRAYAERNRQAWEEVAAFLEEQGVTLEEVEAAT